MTWRVGLLVTLGALMMLLKGLLLMLTGNDRSLVPWFGLLSGIGLTLAAAGLFRSVPRLRSLASVAVVIGSLGVGASIVAVSYLVTGTIPETADAPDSVGASYVVLTIGLVVCVLLVGIVTVVNRALPGRWRWLPLGVLVAQFPIFVVAEAVGEATGSVDVTDGLGLALTGAAWMLLGYALTLLTHR